MKSIIIGNAIFFVGCLINSLIGLLKDKKKVLFYQCFQYAVMGAGSFVLGAFSGVIADAVSIIRNVYCLKADYKGFAKYAFVLIQTVLTIVFNKEGLIGYLPLVAACIYTLFLGVSDLKKFKTAFMFTQILWAIYDFIHLNIVAGIFDIIAVITNLISIKRIIDDERKQ